MLRRIGCRFSAQHKRSSRPNYRPPFMAAAQHTKTYHAVQQGGGNKGFNHKGDRNNTRNSLWIADEPPPKKKLTNKTTKLARKKTPSHVQPTHVMANEFPEVARKIEDIVKSGSGGDLVVSGAEGGTGRGHHGTEPPSVVPQHVLESILQTLDAFLPPSAFVTTSAYAAPKVIALESVLSGHPTLNPLFNKKSFFRDRTFHQEVRRVIVNKLITYKRHGDAIVATTGGSNVDNSASPVAFGVEFNAMKSYCNSVRKWSPMLLLLLDAHIRVRFIDDELALDGDTRTDEKKTFSQVNKKPGSFPTLGNSEKFPTVNAELGKAYVDLLYKDYAQRCGAMVVSSSLPDAATTTMMMQDLVFGFYLSEAVAARVWRHLFSAMRPHWDTQGGNNEYLTTMGQQTLQRLVSPMFSSRPWLLQHRVAQLATPAFDAASPLQKLRKDFPDEALALLSVVMTTLPPQIVDGEIEPNAVETLGRRLRLLTKIKTNLFREIETERSISEETTSNILEKIDVAILQWFTNPVLPTKEEGSTSALNSIDRLDPNGLHRVNWQQWSTLRNLTPALKCSRMVTNSVLEANIVVNIGAPMAEKWSGKKRKCDEDQAATNSGANDLRTDSHWINALELWAFIAAGKATTTATFIKKPSVSHRRGPATIDALRPFWKSAEHLKLLRALTAVSTDNRPSNGAIVPGSDASVLKDPTADTVTLAVPPRSNWGLACKVFNQIHEKELSASQAGGLRNGVTPTALAVHRDAVRCMDLILSKELQPAPQSHGDNNCAPATTIVDALAADTAEVRTARDAALRLAGFVASKPEFVGMVDNLTESLFP